MGNMLDKKSQTKQHARLRDDTPTRLNKKELQDKVTWILAKEVCQICEVSRDLDYPHHSIYGLGVKDDDSLVNTCVKCHRTIHTEGYDNLSKTREEIEQIGVDNTLEYKAQN